MDISNSRRIRNCSWFESNFSCVHTVFEVLMTFKNGIYFISADATLEIKLNLQHNYSFPLRFETPAMPHVAYANRG